MKPIQLDILSAIQERDKGIERAIDHANSVTPNWSDIAFDKLKEFLQIFTDPFQAEDVRSFAAVDDEFPLPPHDRAWGGIFKRAVCSGLIKKIGHKNTKSVRSHCTPAALWQKV